MPAIQTLLIARSTFYTEALARILEAERGIRLNIPSDFVLPLPPNSAAGGTWVVIYDLNANHLVFDAYMDQLANRPYPPRVLAYGDSISESAMLYCLSRGVHGCILSAKLKTLLTVALKHVADGGIWFPHKTISQFVEKVVKEMTPVSRLFREDPLLSKREREVWTMVSQGATNKDIAIRLNIAERTVKFHVSHLLQKLNVDNRRELIVRYGRTAMFEAPIVMSVTRR